MYIRDFAKSLVWLMLRTIQAKHISVIWRHSRPIGLMSLRNVRTIFELVPTALVEKLPQHASASSCFPIINTPFPKQISCSISQQRWAAYQTISFISHLQHHDKIWLLFNRTQGVCGVNRYPHIVWRKTSCRTVVQLSELILLFYIKWARKKTFKEEFRFC